MKNNANIELSLPQSKRSGTSINSKIFMHATTRICKMALSLDLNLLNAQIAIMISDIPISIVKGLE
ncbi:hypothetical protein AUTU_20370 [Aureibacter tunicatorum]|nr:hypothetical protein AUTU_20370 [Aureibacter tunicatorum]